MKNGNLTRRGIEGALAKKSLQNGNATDVLTATATSNEDREDQTALMGDRPLADILYDSQAPSVTVTEGSEFRSILSPGDHSVPDFVNAMSVYQSGMSDAEAAKAFQEEAYVILETFHALSDFFITHKEAKAFHPIKFKGSVASPEEILFSRKLWQLVANYGAEIITKTATARVVGIYPCYESRKVNVKTAPLQHHTEMDAIQDCTEVDDVTFEEKDVEGELEGKYEAAYYLPYDIVHIKDFIPGWRGAESRAILLPTT